MTSALQAVRRNECGVTPMIAVTRFRTPKRSAGYSLIETVLVLPLLIMIMLNAINFGYYFLVALNLSAASRSASEYAATGEATPGTVSLPPVAPLTGVTNPCPSYNTNCYVSTTAVGDFKLPASTSSTVKICSPSYVPSTGPAVDANGNPVSSCVKGSGTSFSSDGTAIADQEGPRFLLQQVDIWYSFTPLIPGTAFNLVTPCAGTCNFHRTLVVRSMN